MFQHVLQFNFRTMRSRYLPRFTRLIILGLSVSLALIACGPRPGEPSLTIAAASSFAPALNELSSSFTRDTGIQLSISFASSGQLAQQIRNGAPFDTFLSANGYFIDTLVEEGTLISESRRVFGTGTLSLLAEPSLDMSPIQLEDLIDPRIDQIVIANPDHAPYGLAALQALQNAGLWDEIENKVVFSESVRQAALFVESGGIPIGLVATSVVPDNLLDSYPIPIDLYEPIEAGVAVNIKSTMVEEAMQFIQYLYRPSSVALFQRYGLTIVVEGP